MKKKLFIGALLAVMLVSFGVTSKYFEKPSEKQNNIEMSVVTPAPFQLEHKEALKVDDAEFTTAVATKYSSIGTGNILGMVALAGLAALFFSSKWEKFPRALQTGFSILALVLVAFIDFGVSAAVAVANAPFALLKFDKNGLSGDNLKLVEDLEKRIKGVSDAEIKELLKADLELAVRSAKEQVQRFNKLTDAQVEDLAKMLDTDPNNKMNIRSILVAQGEMITKLQQNVTLAEERMDIRSQVKDWQTKNKEAIGKIKAGEKSGLPAFELRIANSPMTPANTDGDSITINAGAAIRQGAPVFDVRRIEPTFWDYIPKGRTNLETYPFVNKKVPADSGAAGFIGPGVAKPGVSFTFEVEKSNAKKVAVSMKMATELLEDIDGMTSYVQSELAYQLKAKVNTTLMTGVLSSTVPAGIQTFSLGFTTSGLSTVNPNNWDCARAVIAQMRAAFINGPIVIFMNPIDVANMDMEKAISQGQYLGISARPIPGGLIVEDNNIPVGYLQAVALDALKTLIYKDFVMKFGWEDDDFTKNLVTVIAEMRLHSFHSDNDAAAFVYDDLADIKSQIAAA